MSLLTFLAEIIPQNSYVEGYGSTSSGEVVAVLLFLCLICIGVAIDLALVVYFLKRPSRPVEWGNRLMRRALPSRTAFFLSVLLMTMYLGCSLAYGIFYPEMDSVEVRTLLFQGAFFNLPAALILLGVFIFNRRQSGLPPDFLWRDTLFLTGLSVLLYLAIVPAVWFYTAVYQTFLHQFGFDTGLQEVAVVFLQPVSVWVRAAMCFVAIVLAPATEEGFFRGVLFPWLIGRIGFWPAVGLVSFLFAAMHWHLPSFFPLFLLSAAFCMAYARTRSLLVPIVMHACFNGISLLLLGLTG